MTPKKRSTTSSRRPTTGVTYTAPDPKKLMEERIKLYTKREEAVTDKRAGRRFHLDLAGPNGPDKAKPKVNPLI